MLQLERHQHQPSLGRPPPRRRRRRGGEKVNVVAHGWILSFFVQWWQRNQSFTKYQISAERFSSSLK